VYRLMQDQYAHAVESLVRPKEDVGHLGNPDMSLAEHLVLFYGGAVIGTRDAAWQEFWGTPRVEVRAHAVAFIGSVFAENDALPPEVSDRLKALLEWRLSVAEDPDGSGDLAMELGHFGWWFRAANLDENWLLVQLERILRITGGRIKDDYDIVERLASIAQAHPMRAMACLRQILEADRDGWLVSGHEEAIREVVRQARLTEEPDAQKAAVDFTHYLGSLGFLQFRDLLSP